MSVELATDSNLVRHENGDARSLLAPSPGSGTPLELERRVETGISSGLVGVGGVLPPVLDACCASRKMWMNPEDSRAVFMDRREEIYVKDKGTPGTIGRADVVVAPDVVADFTDMPFPDESFWHVTFDPPHYTAASMTPQSCLAKCYGMLLPGWEEMLRAGFEECFRVLKPNGTLIFKWCATEIPLSHVLSLTPHKALYGHRSGRKAQTHWIAFLKGGGGAEPVREDVCEKPKSPNDPSSPPRRDSASKTD